MKKLILIVAVLLLFPACATVASDAAAEPQTLEGEYVWERSDKNITGPLKAVFEPTGKDSWNVAFYFTFEEEDHIYKGTATGSLVDGEISGEVMTDGDEPRPFSFSGTVEGGKLTGKHWSERDGEVRETGTMTLG